MDRDMLYLLGVLAILVVGFVALANNSGGKPTHTALPAGSVTPSTLDSTSEGSSAGDAGLALPSDTPNLKIAPLAPIAPGQAPTK